MIRRFERQPHCRAAVLMISPRVLMIREGGLVHIDARMRPCIHTYIHTYIRTYIYIYIYIQEARAC